MKSLRGAFLIILLLLALHLASQTDLKASPIRQGSRYPFTAVIVSPSNLRAGPSTAHAIAGERPVGAIIQVVRCSENCEWYQLATGEWIAAFLTDVSSNRPIGETTATSTQAEGSAASVLPSGPMTNNDANLRSGPGTHYPVADGAKVGQGLSIRARNGAGDWYQLSDGNWIAAFLVDNAPGMLPVATPLEQAATQQISAAAAPTVTPLPTPQAITAVAPAQNPHSGQRSGAICGDGSTSSATGRGACSHHGGVAQWLYYP